MLQLHAMPYSGDHSGFYFDSEEDYETKYDLAYAEYGTEEYEIQFIEGSDVELAVFKLMKVGQATISEYFDTVDGLDDSRETLAAIQYLTDNGHKDLSYVDDVQVFHGTKEDYAYEFMNDCYFTSETPDIFRTYFDFEGFARDMEINGEVYEVRIGGETYTITNAAEV